MKPKKLNRYWREVQREQLGVTGNLYMVFASAILAYVVNFLLTHKEEISCIINILLVFGGVMLLLSLAFHGCFAYNRLKDFRKTARLYKRGKSERAVAFSTKKDGEQTWTFFNFQILSLILGFVLSLLGFIIFIYS